MKKITNFSKTTEIAIVFNPVLNQKFTARRGMGAYYNKTTKMSVSDTKELKNALVSTDFGSCRESKKIAVIMENISKVINVAHGYGLFANHYYLLSYL